MNSYELDRNCGGCGGFDLSVHLVDQGGAGNTEDSLLDRSDSVWPQLFWDWTGESSEWHDRWGRCDLRAQVDSNRPLSFLSAWC
jgi:hypothetical protein